MKHLGVLVIALATVFTRSAFAISCEDQASSAVRVAANLIGQALVEQPSLEAVVARFAKGKEWFNPLTKDTRALGNLSRKDGIAQALRQIPKGQREALREALRELLKQNSRGASRVAKAREQTREVLAPTVTDYLSPGLPGAFRISGIRRGEFEGRPVFMASFENFMVGRINGDPYPLEIKLFDPFNPVIDQRTTHLHTILGRVPMANMLMFKRNGKTFAAVYGVDYAFELDSREHTTLEKIGLGHIYGHYRPLAVPLTGIDDLKVGSKQLFLGFNNEPGSHSYTRAYDVAHLDGPIDWEIPEQLYDAEITTIDGKDYLVSKFDSLSTKVLVRDLTSQSLDYRYVETEDHVRLRDAALFHDEGRLYLALSEFIAGRGIQVSRVDIATGNKRSILVGAGTTHHIFLYSESGIPHLTVESYVNSSEGELFTIDLRNMTKRLVEKFNTPHKFFSLNDSLYAIAGQDSDIVDLQSKQKIASLRTGSQEVVRVEPFTYKGHHYQFVVFGKELPVIVQLTRAEQ